MRKIITTNKFAQTTIVERRTIDDFSNMDLSNLDLSTFEPEFWEGAIFYNTNFSNTGIRFDPSKLKGHSIKKCNFENVDLSSIPEELWRNVLITDANLKNTGIKIKISYCHQYSKDDSIGAVLLDEDYWKKTIEYWDDCPIDLSTLQANRFIHISPHKLLELIQKLLKKTSVFLTQNQILKLVDDCEGILKEFDDGTINTLYELVCKDFDSLDRLKFFQGYVEGKTYQNLILTDFSTKLLEMIEFSNCTFGEITINNKLEDLLQSHISFFHTYLDNKSLSITLQDLNLDSWKKLNTSPNRLGDITFKKFLYLELGMMCNCNCEICRNQSFDGECEPRNISRILDNLDIMKQYVDTIFIGGGEPSLYLDDFDQIRKHFSNLVLVTNGSIGKDTLNSILNNYTGIYISRHAISDERNISILKPAKSTNILSMKDIATIAKKESITLTPVCQKGGLDSSVKIIEYIAKSFELGIKKIIISTLHSNASMGKNGIDYKNLYVDPNILNDVFSILLAQGFTKFQTICSTGGYILERFVKATIHSRYTVSFKIYISKETFPKYWKDCVKRTFDFTMTQSGDVYQDWCRNKMINLEEIKV